MAAKSWSIVCLVNASSCERGRTGISADPNNSSLCPDLIGVIILCPAKRLIPAFLHCERNLDGQALQASGMKFNITKTGIPPAQVADMINGEDDAPEEEEVVLDLEHPSFDDARSQQQHAPQPDLIDELEFGEDGTPLSPGSRHSRPQRQGEAQQPLPSTGQPTAAGWEQHYLRRCMFIASRADLQACAST